MNLVAHHYHPSTLLYTHSSALNVTAGYKTPLIPQCASLTALPNYDHSTQVLKIDIDKNIWQVVKKYQAITAYHKQTQEPKKFDDESLVTDGYTLIPPPTPYHDFDGSEWQPNHSKAIDAKHTEIEHWRLIVESDETQVVEAVDHTWDAGPKSQQRIDGFLIAEQVPPYWTDADNIDVVVSLEELRQVRDAINDYVFLIHERQKAMKQEVKELTDFDAILDYPVGW